MARPDLRWRLAVVTGGGGGLGREIAVGLGRRGVGVLVADRDLAAAGETVRLLKQTRVAAWAVQTDLADEVDVLRLDARMRDLGGADLLVNNAGGWTVGDRQYPRAHADSWSRTLALNLRAPMLLTQCLLDDLERRGVRPERGAAVVNVASSAATEAEPYGSPEYAAAKAGLIRFTTAMGAPVGGAGARVMAVVPGWIRLDRAVEQEARLSADERSVLPRLIPPARVVAAVVRLLDEGRAGEVVHLRGAPRAPAPTALGPDH